MGGGVGHCIVTAPGHAERRDEHEKRKGRYILKQ